METKGRGKGITEQKMVQYASLGERIGGSDGYVVQRLRNRQEEARKERTQSYQRQKASATQVHVFMSVVSHQHTARTLYAMQGEHHIPSTPRSLLAFWLLEGRRPFILDARVVLLMLISTMAAPGAPIASPPCKTATRSTNTVQF